MKRIIIIFIIAVCLISFVEISCLSSAGETWNQLTSKTKIITVVAYTAGIQHCFIKLVPLLTLRSEQEPPSNEDKRLWEEEMKVINELYEIFSCSDDYLLDIIKVVTDLYEDPANTRISISIMIDIAYQKLKGEDIEPLLREARGKALLFEKEEKPKKKLKKNFINGKLRW
ncbi:hypothetical protein ES705_41437 [subsurface metagenome]|jgi:hypothetical protein